MERVRERKRAYAPEGRSKIESVESTRFITGQRIEFATHQPFILRKLEGKGDVILALMMAYDETKEKWYAYERTEGADIVGVKAWQDSQSKLEYFQLNATKSLIVADENSASLKVLNDDTLKGLFRSIGDAGDSPLNTGGSTMLQRLSSVDGKLLDVKNGLISDAVKGLFRSFGDCGGTPVNATGKTVLKLLTEVLAELATLSSILDATDILQAKWNITASGSQETTYQNSQSKFKAGIMISIFAEGDGQLDVIWSMDGTNPEAAETKTLTISTYNVNHFVIKMPYFKIKVTNNAASTRDFEICAKYVDAKLE